ncbi:phosphotyrosine-specific ptp2-like protein, partial [Coemansia erecta]
GRNTDSPLEQVHQQPPTDTAGPQACNDKAAMGAGRDGPTGVPSQKRGAPSPAIGSESVASRTNWESGRGRAEGRSPMQHMDQQTSSPFWPGVATSQSTGAGPGPNASAPFTASIAQRRMQRRPMGLRLDNIAGSGIPPASLGANSNGPPPTAHGTWTMGGHGAAQPPTMALPAVPSGRWDDSAPSTPGPGQTNSLLAHQQNRPLGIVGAGFNPHPSSSGSGYATPSDAAESLTSFQRHAGPLSSSYGGVVPGPVGSFGVSSKDMVLGGAASYGGSSGSLARRPSARQQRVYPLNRVAGLNYINIAELTAMLGERAGAKRGLVIDMRRSVEYLTARVVSAINMTVPTTLVKRRTFVVERLLAMLSLTGEQKQLADNWKSAAWVVLYGEGAPEDTASEDTSLVLMARKFMSEAPESCKVFVLQDGFKEFGRKHTSLCEFGGGGRQATAASISSLSLPPSTLMPMMSAPLVASSTPLAMPENANGLPMLSRPLVTGLKPAVEVDHPMLRTMRQMPGGGFDPSEVVAMRLPHDFSSQQRTMPGAAHESQQLQALPSYLRRAADPETGPRLLNSLFRKIDDSENKRLSSMIGSNGMRTKYNDYTISAGLELGQKNRYKNVFPFDRNRVRLRSTRRARESSGASSGAVVEPTSQPSFDDGPSAGVTPAGSMEESDAGSMGESLQMRLHGGRPFSIDAIGARPSSLQGIDSARFGRKGSTKRSSHQVESKSKGQLLVDDVDSMSSGSDFSGGVEQSNSDYVNASYVKYFNGPMYIATQGPLPATVNDFWRMVWEEHSRVIVMLTKEFETGRPKCHRYWPAQPGEAAMYGNFRVEFQAEAQHPDDASVIARRFRLTRPSVSQASMCITHLQYTGWADHGIPENPLGVLRLRQLAHQAQTEGELQAAAEHAEQVPMIVHCSAGCGRTGAFCVIDTIMSIDKDILSSGAANQPPAAASADIVDADGDVSMGDANRPKKQMQMLPSGSSYDRHGMFTGLIPQALRSKSSSGTLKSQTRDEEQEVEMSQAMCTPESDQTDAANNRRSLSQWNDEPPAELRDDRVYMIVSRFRELRVTMVQTIKQFVFCHEALAWAALGATPRPIDHIIDRRLVAEWNRKNHPEIDEADCTDITYMMRGRQEIVHAMLSSEIGGSGKGSANAAAATISGGGPAGRASIDVVSGMPSDSDDASDSGPPVVKRSNTVGPGRRWLIGSLFKSSGSGANSYDNDSQSAPTSRVASRQRDLVSSVVTKEKQPKPSPGPRIIPSLSSGPRIGTSTLTLSPQAPIAEEESSSAMESEESEYGVAGVGSAAQAFAAAVSAAGRTRARMPMPNLPLPPAPAPVPPMMTCGIREPSDDYFGVMSNANIESPEAMDSTGGSNQEPANAYSGGSVGWRHNMLGHMDAAGEVVARRRRAGADAPRSPHPYMSSSALASPSAQ